MFENELRNEQLRSALHTYKTETAIALNTDEYAQHVYEANRSSGL